MIRPSAPVVSPEYVSDSISIEAHPVITLINYNGSVNVKSHSAT